MCFGRDNNLMLAIDCSNGGIALDDTLRCRHFGAVVVGDIAFEFFAFGVFALWVRYDKIAYAFGFLLIFGDTTLLHLPFLFFIFVYLRWFTFA